jgi:hypothetical protein
MNNLPRGPFLAFIHSLGIYDRKNQRAGADAKSKG